MKTIKIELFEFNELPEEVQAKVLDKNRYINVESDWWDCTYEDAANIGLKLTEFDLDRNRHAKGEFTLPAYQVACKIKSDHGETCETYKTAVNFLAEYEKLDPENNEAEAELEEEFLKSLLEDYALMLERECEYLQSDEAVRETIEANEYTFEANGKMRNA